MTPNSMRNSGDHSPKPKDMKEILNIKRIVLGAFLGTVALIVTGTAGCTTSRQAPGADTAHTPAPEATQACRANLHAIEGAKRAWALEHGQINSTIPTDADLFGSTSYIREKPKCPSGGSYTIRAVEDHPLCSIPGHVY